MRIQSNLLQIIQQLWDKAHEAPTVNITIHQIESIGVILHDVYDMEYVGESIQVEFKPGSDVGKCCLAMYRLAFILKKPVWTMFNGTYICVGGTNEYQY